jgi:hypothetical protein
VRYFIAALLMIAGLVLLLTLPRLGPDPGPADGEDDTFYRSQELDEARECGRQLDDAVRCQRVFQARVKDTLEALLARAVGLEEAARRIEAAAQKYNPQLLPILQRMTPEASSRQRFALLVINHLRIRRELAQLSPEQKKVVDEILCELSGWPDLAPAVRRQLGLDP